MDNTYILVLSNNDSVKFISLINLIHRYTQFIFQVINGNSLSSLINLFSKIPNLFWTIVFRQSSSVFLPPLNFYDHLPQQKMSVFFSYPAKTGLSGIILAAASRRFPRPHKKIGFPIQFCIFSSCSVCSWIDKPGHNWTNVGNTKGTVFIVSGR